MADSGIQADMVYKNPTSHGYNQAFSNQNPAPFEDENYQQPQPPQGQVYYEENRQQYYANAQAQQGGY
jgi:hypothetical protein